MTFLKTILTVFLLLCPSAVVANSQSASIAFYYNEQAPVNSLQMFDWVVLQGSMSTSKDINRLSAMGSVPIGYLSLGEIAHTTKDFKNINPSWFIGKNNSWGSSILDWRNAEVQDYLIDNQAAKLWQQGFKGFFLDTLDSYLLTDQGKKNASAFQSALVELVSKLKLRYPQAVIINNRGFEVIPRIYQLIDAVAFESLFTGYDIVQERYRPVSKEAGEWLLEQAKNIKQQYQLSVIAIDYVAPGDSLQRNKIVAKIKAEGLIPWVADGHLQTLGGGLYEPVHRVVLGIHDQPENEIDKTGVHRYIATPLEYLGYQLDYTHVDRLPNLDEISALAGIVVYLEHIELQSTINDELCLWLTDAHKTYNIPVVFMHQLPSSHACSQLANIVKVKPSGRLSKVSSTHSYEKYQGHLQLRRSTTNIQLRNNSLQTPAQSWLTLQDGEGRHFHPVAITDSGGYAFSPFVFERGFEESLFWLFDPFEFLSAALQLKQLPAPDVTTESGRRIVTAHIDGDGFVSRAEQENVMSSDAQLSGQVILDQILKGYPIPHTVSIIEGEISNLGQFPKLAKSSEPIAREIFRLPWVEIASHTFSHPFFWLYFEGEKAIEDAGYGYHMAIPNYQANLEKEIVGSTEYINKVLAPADKKVKVLLWSGDALPGEKALNLTAQQQLLNVNGGDTKVVRTNNSLAYIWPIGRPVGEHYQIYAPVMNENRYTSLWTGPYYGYRQVIETFELLDKPLRLKPISIYYHFYSGSKLASLKALQDVYQWAYQQNTTAMYLSDYARRANDFYRTGLAKVDDSTWLIKRPGALNTLRIPVSMGKPDIAGSSNIIGFIRERDNYYIHLAPGIKARLALSTQPERSKKLTTSLPYLHDSNGIIEQWQISDVNDQHWQLTVSAAAGRPLEISLANRTKCQAVDTTIAFLQQPFSREDVSGAVKGVKLLFKQQRVKRLLLDCQ